MKTIRIDWWDFPDENESKHNINRTTFRIIDILDYIIYSYTVTIHNPKCSPIYVVFGLILNERTSPIDSHYSHKYRMTIM